MLTASAFAPTFNNGEHIKITPLCTKHRGVFAYMNKMCHYCVEYSKRGAVQCHTYALNIEIKRNTKQQQS